MTVGKLRFIGLDCIASCRWGSLKWIVHVGAAEMGRIPAAHPPPPALGGVVSVLLLWSHSLTAKKICPLPLTAHRNSVSPFRDWILELQNPTFNYRRIYCVWWGTSCAQHSEFNATFKKLPMIIEVGRRLISAKALLQEISFFWLCSASTVHT